jgi:serralysin
VWNTDSAGNYLSNAIGVVSGRSWALENLEAGFHQDLNGDGVVGVTSTLLDPGGATPIYQVADSYALGGTSGLLLKFSGAAVVVGQFGSWTPIGAEQTSFGYEIAWKMTGADQYTVWNTDGAGNYVSNAIGVVSGGSWALENLEAGFNQDLNGDGVVGVTSTLLNAGGATPIYQVADSYALGSASGPLLKSAGAPVVAGGQGAWTPIGAAATATGFEVAWKAGSADQYTVWNTDGAGNFVSDDIGVVSGSSSVLEGFESAFHQDLNGDGTVGIPPVFTDSSAGLTLANASLLTSYAASSFVGTSVPGSPGASTIQSESQTDLTKPHT